GVVLALGWTLTQPKVYSADSTAIVRADTGSDDIGSMSLGNNVANQKVKTYVELGSSRSVAGRVIEELSLDESPDALVSSINVTNPLDTTSLRVTASASTPEKARDIAEAWVRGMAAEVNDIESGDATKQG